MKGVADQLRGILNDFEHELGDKVTKAVESTAKGVATNLKATSPTDTGDYAKGWAAKRAAKSRTSTWMVVHNKTDYQLTHLLEHGHEVFAYGKVIGRAPAHPHIKQAEQAGISELLNKVENL